MNFEGLHEAVRTELERRVNAGLLTASSLARQVGFQQAHISNFLNRRRALSLPGLDRVLAAQNLTVEELLPLEIQGGAAPDAPKEFSEAIPLVSPATAMEEAVVRPAAVIESVTVPAALLAGSRPRDAARYRHWQRFVAIRADAQQAAAMEPMILPESVVVLDRQYRSVAPYRAHQRTLYAVRAKGGLQLRFVEFDGGWLLLRPLSIDFPVQMISPRTGEAPAEPIVGRVVLVMHGF